ncbi:hypothetical protein [Pedobacter sp. CFBP9032]|uniref:hypothetical protein n=1 Tax=Pedobacter sp. CFBP9032 TaxID=3096539 RepID=UPI002A6B8E1F|nr:hypothetical protein [Pedobacter sp. CFBP9032]MDY0904889.1 hypothetical protein [Pedobacter sp. CFBP9032]
MWAKFNSLITKCTHLLDLPNDYKGRLDIKDYNIPEQSKARKWIFDQLEVVLDFAETTNGK